MRPKQREPYRNRYGNPQPELNLYTPLIDTDTLASTGKHQFLARVSVLPLSLIIGIHRPHLTAGVGSDHSWVATPELVPTGPH